MYLCTWLFKKVVLEVKLRLSGLDSKHFADRYFLSSRFGIDTNEEWGFSHKNLQSPYVHSSRWMGNEAQFPTPQSRDYMAIWRSA